MTLEEKKNIVEQTLRDMYLLLKRSQEFANDMSEQLSGTARDYMVTAAYMSECATMPLFNCAGALGIDLAKWSADFDKGYEKAKEGRK